MSSLEYDFRDCSICMEPFTDPKVWPCGHTFCGSCADRLTEDKRKIRCPTCNEIHDVNQLRLDHTLNKFCAVLDERNAQIQALKAKLEVTDIELQANRAELRVRNDDVMKLRKALHHEGAMMNKIQGLEAKVGALDTKLQGIQVDFKNAVTKKQIDSLSYKQNIQQNKMDALLKSVNDVDMRLRSFQGQQAKVRNKPGKHINFSKDRYFHDVDHSCAAWLVVTYGYFEQLKTYINRRVWFLAASVFICMVITTWFM